MTPGRTPTRIDPSRLSVRQASVVCNVSMDTVRRRLAEGVPGAFREPDGSWAIPIGGLAAVGMVPRLERLTGGGANEPPAVGSADDVADLRARCAAAEALATARAEHIADLRSEVEVLRVLLAKVGEA